MTDDANIRVTATDETQSVWKELGETLKKTSNTAQTALAGGMNKELDRTKEKIEWAGRAGKESIERGITASFMNANKVVEAFAETMTEALSVAAVEEFGRHAFSTFASLERTLGRVGFAAHASKDQMEGLSTGMEDVATKVGISVEDLVKNFDDFRVKSGLSFEAAQQGFKNVADFSRVMGVSIESGTRLAAAAINSLKVPVEDIPKLLDGWSETIPPSMLEPFANVAPKIFTIFSQMGFEGKKTAIDLSSMFIPIQNAFNNTRAAAGEFLGLWSQMTSPSNSLGMIMLPMISKMRAEGKTTEDVIEAIYVKLEKMHLFDGTDLSKKSIANYLSIDDNQLAMLKKGRDNIQEFRDRIEAAGDSSGRVAKRLKQMAEDAQSSSETMGSAFEKFETSVGKVISPVVVSGLHAVSSIFTTIADAVEKAGKGVSLISGILSGQGGHEIREKANEAIGQQPFGEKYDFLNKSLNEGIHDLSSPEERERLERMQKLREGSHAPAMPDWLSKKTPFGGPANMEEDPYSKWKREKEEDEEADRKYNEKHNKKKEESLPHHAEGGIVTKKEVAVIGEKGPEAVIPLSKISGAGHATDDNTTATRDNTFAVNRLSSLVMRKGAIPGSSGLAYTPGAGEVGVPSEAGVTAGGQGYGAVSAAGAASAASGNGGSYRIASYGGNGGGYVAPKTSSSAQKYGGSGPQQKGAGTGGGEVPSDILSAAREHALKGGPGAVEQFMASQGYPKAGNWCGEFAASVIKSVGGTPPKDPAIASNWRNWGHEVDGPQAGAIAVRRGARTGDTGSHVTIAAGESTDGRFSGIGGNQRSGPQSSFPTSQYQFYMPNKKPGESETGSGEDAGSRVKGSVFSDRTTASGLSAATTSGIALPKGGKMGDRYEVTAPNGQKMIAPLIDRGPAKWTGRGADISKPLAKQLGYSGEDGDFPTDSKFNIRKLKDEKDEKNENWSKENIRDPLWRIQVEAIKAQVARDRQKKDLSDHHSALDSLAAKHASVRDQMEKPIQMSINSPDMSGQRGRVQRQRRRVDSEEAFNQGAVGSMADIGII